MHGDRHDIHAKGSERFQAVGILLDRLVLRVHEHRLVRRDGLNDLALIRQPKLGIQNDPQ